MKKFFKIFFILLTAATALLLATACGDDERHEHTFANRWSYDVTHHWHAATCGHTSERSDYGLHDFITENGNTYCKVCKYGCTHDYFEKVTAATCEAGGYTEYTCFRCGDSYTGNETPAIGHNFAYTTVTEPTLESGGKILGICANDDSHTVEYDLPAFNAGNYKLTASKTPSCEREGSASYRYSLPDGKTVTYRVTLPANGHACGEDGVCSVCGRNGYYEYSKNDSSVTITAYTGPDVRELVIPSKIEDRSVTAIASSAFANCTELESVTVPSTVTLINAYAFANCADLKSVHLLMNSVNLHAKAFIGCDSLETAEIPNSAIHVFPKETLREVTVTNGTYIDVSAFEGCAELERVTLPDTLTEIRASAFKDCGKLMSIAIPANVKNIRQNAFANCYKLVEIFNLSALAISPATAGNYGGLGAFAKEILTANDESILRETNGFIYFSQKGETYLLHYEGSNAYLALPDSLGGNSYSVYPYAFYGRTDLLHVTLPKGLNEIGENAFLDCYKLSEVCNESSLEIEKNEENGRVGFYAYTIYSDSENTSLSYDGDFIFIIESQKYYLIHYAGTDSEITLPAHHRGRSYRIGAHAFYGCESLTRITVTNAVLSVGASAFEGCSAQLAFQNVSVLETVEAYAFYGYAGTSLSLPTSVTAIEDYAFGNCANLQTLYLPSSIASVGAMAFYGCTALESVYYAGTLTDWCAVSFGTETSGKYVTSYANPMRYANRFFVNGGDEPSEITSITLPESVTGIGAWQFMGFEGVKSILLHENVTRIGCGAFSGCSGITELTVPQNAELSGAMLEGCTSLQTLTLPTANVVETGGAGTICYGFAHLFGSKSIAGTYEVKQFYTQNETLLGDGIHYIPTSLKTVKLTGTESGVLHSLAFYRCAQIERIELSNSFTKIGTYAFMYCTALKAIILPQEIVAIGTNAFYCNKDSVLKIYYRGTQEQWNELVNGKEKDLFYNFEIEYGYTG